MMAMSSCKQSKAWCAAGLDFEKLITAVIDKSLHRSITKFHGNQIPSLFSKWGAIWQTL